MPHWFLGLSSLVSSFFSFSLISLISYLLLFLKSDRSLVPNCCSDLTPTQAIKSSEAIVGTWTTGGRMGRQISFRIFFYPLLFICFLSQFIYDYPFSLQHSHLFFYLCDPLPFLSCSLFYPLSCLSLSFSLPPHSLDWLEWVKQANLFSQGLKLPACLFGCGEAQMISALPSVTAVHVVRTKSKSALFV